MELPQTLRDAIAAMSKLPGIGEKTAMRMVLHLTRWRSEELKQVSTAIKNLIDVKHCQECGFFSESNICQLCAEPSRTHSGLICVVENVTDLLAIERSGHFKGLYHVLGGVLNPLMGIGPDQLHLSFLFERIKKNNIQEVILALNPSVEGDATCAFIRDIIPESVRVERIGFGVPIGGNLEYLDSMTISKALENRKIF
jgi:recombination protein RecR